MRNEAANVPQFHRELRPSCRKLHLDPRKLTFRDLTVLIVNWMMLTPSSHHSWEHSF